MIQPPLPGTPYVVTISTPSDFHRQQLKSRFHLTFARQQGAKWIFDLRKPIRLGRKLMSQIEAFPRKPDQPLDVETLINIALCRFIDTHGQASDDWLITTLVPDLVHDAPIPFWPPWKGLAQTA